MISVLIVITAVVAGWSLVAGRLEQRHVRAPLILPIMLAFLGSTFTWRERLMVGALGPRGTTSIVFGLLAFNALPDGQYADTALYAMTLTVLGSVLLHGGGSAVIARSLTGPPPSAAGGPGSPGTDEPDSRVVAMQG